MSEIERLCNKLNKNLKVLYHFSIAHVGWECDDIGWVVEDSETKERHIVLTDHGGPYIADPEELRTKCNEYDRLKKETQTALDFFFEKK